MNIQVLSDQHLLNNYRSGDQSAISKLIERHKRRVRDYIYMMVKDNDVADDIFQETFIKVIRVIDEGRYTDNGKFLSWVLRIAHANRKRRAQPDRTASGGAARGGDDALLLRYEFQGDRRANRRKHQHSAGTHALCTYQPAAHD